MPGLFAQNAVVMPTAQHGESLEGGLLGRSSASRATCLCSLSSKVRERGAELKSSIYHSDTPVSILIDSVLIIVYASLVTRMIEIGLDLEISIFLFCPI